MLSPRAFTTGGLFLFIPDLVRLESDAWAQAAKLPGSRMVPSAHSLRASLAARTSSVGSKAGFEMALLVLASGLYRLRARRMRGDNDAQARQIFRDLIDMHPGPGPGTGAGEEERPDQLNLWRRF